MDPTRLYEEGVRRGVGIGPSMLNSLDGTQLSGVRLTFCAEPSEKLIEGAKRLGKAAHAIAASSRPRTAADGELSAMGAV